MSSHNHRAGQVLGSDARAWFDAYSVRAHWAPMLALTSPVIFGLVAAFPTLQSWHGALAAAVPPVLGQLARNMGKRIEAELWASWGGPPTTRLLRHRDTTIPEATKRRYFDTLLKSAGIVRPSAVEEDSHPQKADEVYESAGAWLRRQTRQPKPGDLVASKNAAYGMQRNLLGLRFLGIPVTALMTVALIGLATWRYQQAENPTALLLAGAAVNACAAVFWSAAVSNGAVRSAADAYGLAILECLEPHGQAPRSAKSSNTTRPVAAAPSSSETPASTTRKRTSKPTQPQGEQL